MGCSFSAHYGATVCLIGVTKQHLGELAPQTASTSQSEQSTHSFKLHIYPVKGFVRTYTLIPTTYINRRLQQLLTGALLTGFLIMAFAVSSNSLK